MSEHANRLNAAKGRLGALSKETPDLFQGFMQISKVASKDGVFSKAQKEIIATAIAVTQGCEDCILYHVDAAKRAGAYERALLEGLEVAVEMGGGPAMMYAGKALDTFRNL